MKPFYMTGRELTANESQKFTEVERALSILHWGIAKALRYTTTVQEVTCYVHTPEHLFPVHSQTAHLRLKAALLNLGMYRVKWAVDAGGLDFGGDLAKALRADTLVPCE